MRRLNDTIMRLRAGHFSSTGGAGPDRAERLVRLEDHGTNPGNLAAWYHVPAGIEAMPLVVVLHGCTQTAAGYDRGSGWSELAARHGFAVVFPEQKPTNNPNLCFNWFSPTDVRRGSGEVLSIREMIATMVARHAIDPDRVFVTGLSAGGAMASALLATYPDVFAGGAIVAGLPFGAAGTVGEAFERMRGAGHVDAERYAELVRAASDHRGRWPAVSIWHGSADATVAPGNADAILGQWLTLHGAGPEPDRHDVVDGAIHRSWRDGSGRVCVEDYRIAGMGHGTPLATAGSRACGVPAAYMLDVGISSTWHSAARWGLLDTGAAIEAGCQPDGTEDVQPRPSLSPSVHAGSGIQDTIEAALRSAGLMR